MANLYQTCVSDRESVSDDGEGVLVVGVAVEPVLLLQVELQPVVFSEKIFNPCVPTCQNTLRSH